jgi:hypothetical protein
VTQTRTITQTRTSTKTRTPTKTPTPTIPRPFGAEVTFFGVATSFNRVKTPDATAADGTPIYIPVFPQGFIIVLEGRPGTSGGAVVACGTQDGSGGINFCFNSDRADVEVEADRPLGNGSTVVCDRTGPGIGGVPGVNPTDFGPAQSITDAINDFACRFADFSIRTETCTFNELGNFSFVNRVSTRQFCTAPAIGAELAFPRGDTRLTAQLRDGGGNIGNQKSIIIRVP